MHRTLILFASVVTLFAAAAFAAGCGGDNGGPSHDMPGMMGSNGGGMGGMMDPKAPEGAIRVDLVNWAVKPAVDSAKAGEVTFFAVHTMQHQHGMNEGGATHDLQVMKKAADGSLQLVGQVQGLAMGQGKALTVTLTPGEYELSCNVAEEVGGTVISHYQKGMHTAFTVT